MQRHGHAPAAVDHAAGPLAAHARGHAARHRPRLQPRRDEPRGRHAPTTATRSARRRRCSSARRCRALPSLRTLPEHVETLANQLRCGRLTRAHRALRRRRPRRRRRLGRPVVDRADRPASARWPAVAAARRPRSTGNDEVQTALWILGFAGLTFSTTLAMRAAARALRRHLERVGSSPWRPRTTPSPGPTCSSRAPAPGRRSPASCSSRSRSTSSGSSRSPGCRSAGWPPWCCCSAS